MDACSAASIITAFAFRRCGARVLEVGLILVLAAHLLLVNVAMAGPLGALGLEWSGARSGDRDIGAIGRQLAWWSVGSLVLAMLLGGALLLLESRHDNSRYWQTLQAITPSQLWFAGAELGFYLLAMIGYLLLHGATRASRITQRGLAFFSATNLMYHFPPLFTALSMISTRPELQGAPLDRAALRELMLESAVIARVSHIWLASLAVLGLAMMACAWRRHRQEPRVAEDAGGCLRVVGWGARLALATSLLQLPVGLWVLGELRSYDSLLGADLVATVLFAVSLLGVLRLLHLLAAVALGDHETRQVVESIALMLIVVTLMTGVLHRVDRHADAARRAVARQEAKVKW